MHRSLIAFVSMADITWIPMQKKMERFHDGLDGKLYDRLNLLEPNNFHELVNKAISQEDAMKKAQRDKKT
jgi:hypothetical protein